MGVTIMSEKPVLLEKLGVSPDSIAQLKAGKIKMAAGFKDIKFLDQNGKMLSQYDWPFGVNPSVIMGGKVTAGLLKAVAIELQAQIAVAISGGIQIPVVVASSESDEIAKQFPNQKVVVSGGGKKPEESVKPFVPDFHPIPEMVPVAPEEVIKQVAVPLKDATALYQPVRGTDKSSRYFVVAINQDIRVAVRINGNAVSIRVEGNLTPEVRKALAEQGIDDKGAYMSKHRTTANTTPAKYIGALLMATGLAFNTPLPSMEIIKNAK